MVKLLLQINKIFFTLFIINALYNNIDGVVYVKDIFLWRIVYDLLMIGIEITMIATLKIDTKVLTFMDGPVCI